MKTVRIVLTGGPGGGKSAFIQELLADNHKGEDRWLFVPEAAPTLFGVGIDTQSQRFQLMALKLSLAMEEICIEFALDNQHIILHRGALDILAYWLFKGWRAETFFEKARKKPDELLKRYNLVIHFQSTAIGAQDFYRRWPVAHRFETIEEAQIIDECCNIAWSSHPKYILLDNAGKTWADKSVQARAFIEEYIGDQQTRGL